MAERGAYPQAEQLARACLHAQPDAAGVANLLGFSVLQQGRAEEATSIFRRATESAPDNAELWNNLGTAERQCGNLREAEQAYMRALALRPNDAGFIANLGLLYVEWKRIVKARDYLRRAVELNPADYEARIFGCQMCLECGDDDRARAIVEGWREWINQIPGVLRVELAVILLRLGFSADGEALLRTQLDDAATGAMACVRLVVTLERLNRLDEARALLARLPEPATITDADLRGEIIEAQVAIAARGPDVAQARQLLEALLAEPGVERRNTMTWFLLAKVCDKQGDVAACMEYLGLAHQSQMQRAIQLLPELAEPSTNPMNIKDYPADGVDPDDWSTVDAPALADSPIFVVGFPRSGTTMLEQMLDAHPSMVSMDEQPFVQQVVERMQAMGLHYPADLGRLSPEQCEILRDTYWQAVAGVAHLGPRQRLVDKNPLTMLRLPLLVRLFPNAKIIFVMRHPCDVIFSNYLQYFDAPAYVALCSTLPRLAAGYANAMRFWVSHVALLRPQVLEWRYEDVVHDFDHHVDRLAAFLELEDAAPLRAFSEHAKQKGYIGTPSYAQVVRPVYASSVGRWERYRRYFEPILPILKPALEQWGYDD